VLQNGERVFFADNSKGGQARADVFQKTVRGMGFVPVFYVGAGSAVRQSSLDSEMRGDFYSARAIVLYFGSPVEGSNDEDHWVLDELGHAIASGTPSLIYVSKDFPRDVLAKHGYRQDPEVLMTDADFGAALRRDLAKLAAN
jgi:hypothetical protein